MEQDLVRNRYLCGEYARLNPDWDSVDSPWKAKIVSELVRRHGLPLNSLVEIGCGAGGVLEELGNEIGGCRMIGYDIAPELVHFWKRISAPNIRFVLGDYFQCEAPVPDLVLVLDVIEHVADPYDFLVRLRERCGTVIFHIPLDLSAVSILREEPLLHVRHKVGHIHYFTKGLALSLLEECGFEVIESTFTGASFDAPHRKFKTKAVSLLRRIFGLINRDFSVRLLGGDTLLVLARARVGK